MGTRERIIAYLTEAGELFDANGMASTQLAAAVGYPGSSVAFAQLLSGMERSGLIEREVRGKRTYRIGLGPARAPGRRGWSPGLPLGFALPRRSPVPWGSEPARQVRGRPGSTTTNWRAACWCRSSGGWRRRTPRRAAGPFGRLIMAGPIPDQLALQETVTGLEYELATAWTKHGKLAEENVRLREQLKAAQRSLALAAEQVRRLPASTDLNSSEVMLLQRLLTAAPAADSADDSGAEAPSLLG